ncbi:serine hydrolase domain-containing protein [Kribbella sp. NPDC051952]|uniref:serine hydrolase domain-containing protein n=1 Tax=Kribbella sp. NPDC051952 TaxID=3154851 RepID=UPI00341C7CAF
MKLAARGLVAVVTAAVVGVVPGVAFAGSDRGALQEKLDGVTATSAVGAVAEVRDGHRVWRGGSGVAVRETSQPVPIRGQFRVGSVTKTFVATVVLQLVAEGKLRLDDSVEHWLPGVVPNGQNISVRELLNHTSGLFDYRLTLPRPGSPEFLDLRWRTLTPAELMAPALAHKPDFEPGKGYSYSNTNYLLVGEIIKKVTGHSYSDEVERRLIRPLGLSGTTMPRTSPWIRGAHMHGYLPTDAGIIDYTDMNPTLFGAGGDMISTASDLNRFFDALLGGHLLPARLLKEMKKPGIEESTYGLGLSWHDTSCHIPVYGNDGDALSYQAYSYSTEDTRKQITVAVTPNFINNPDAAVDAVINQAICN